MKPLEILLEGEPGLQGVRAHGGQLGEALHHGVGSTLKGGVPGHAGDVAVAHGGGVVGLAVEQGDLGHHGLLGGQLVLAGERHQHRARANAGVEPLGQALLAADLQPGHILLQGLCALFAGQAGGHALAVALALGRGDLGLGVLGDAVGIQKGAGQVDNLIAPPLHAQPGLLCHHGHHGGVQVLLAGLALELLHILGRQHHGHALLAFGNGQLGAVQALIFLGHLVQVDLKAGGQLADGHAHAARAKVVAALDEGGDAGVPEQALELPLGGGVALLHLGAADLHALFRVGLAGAGGPADAVTAGGPAQQHDHISRDGLLPADIGLGRGADDRADLHALGNVAGVVQLGDLAGGQADLVAVGGIPRGSAGGDLPAGQLAVEGLFKGHGGVAAAGDTHGLVHIGPAGEGVPDGAAQAGGGPAEGLDLRGVVVGLVLELDEPGFGLAVDGDGGLDGAGVDLIAHIQVGHQALFPQVLAADGGHVHQGHGLVLALVQLLPQGEVVLQSLFHGLAQSALLHVDLVQAGEEGGVAAVVAPIGVDDPQLGDGGVPVLLIPEVVPAELQVREGHGKAHGVEVLLHLGPVPAGKAGDTGHVRGNLSLQLQAFRLFLRGFPAFHRVDEIPFDLLKLLVRNPALQANDLGGEHGGALPLGQQLHALGGRVRPLVILAGKVLHGEHLVFRRKPELLPIDRVHGGLGEDGAGRSGELLPAEARDIVPVEDTHLLQPLNAQVAL